MATSDTFATMILEGTFGTSKGANAPASLFIALSSTAPTYTLGVIDNVTEPTNGSYARVEIVNNDTNWTTTDRVCTNNVQLEFPTATADWDEEIAHAVVYDAAAAGNALIPCSLGSSTPILNGVRVVLEIGSITITVPNA